MRSLRGNTVSQPLEEPPHEPTFRSWKDRRRISAHDHFVVGALNVSGLVVPPRRLPLVLWITMRLKYITETHDLQSHLHRAFSEHFWLYRCVFSPDPDDKHYAGVALFLKRSRFWQLQPVAWVPADVCCNFHREGRLLAVQAWCGNGGPSILF